MKTNKQFLSKINSTKSLLKKNLKQILALTEKNIKLNTRYKFNLIVNYITPIISILIPLLIFEKLFSLNETFAPWTGATYLVFILSSYNLSLLKGITEEFPAQLKTEKFWKTLSALIIAPFNRFNLLIGIFLSNIILISVPFILILVLNYFVFPISFSTLLFVIFVYCIIALILSGIGLILGVFAISQEDIFRVLKFMLNFIFYLSCITYPFALFTPPFQFFISINPLYYIFTFLRFSWIDNNVFITITTYPYHFLITVLMAIFLPLIGVYTFNKVYKKYGIVGY